MTSLRELLKRLMVLQAITQVAWWKCQAQIDDSRLDSWDHKRDVAEHDLKHALVHKSILAEDQSERGDSVSSSQTFVDTEQEPLKAEILGYSTRGDLVIKRGAKERREKGKKRKMAKHERRGQLDQDPTNLRLIDSNDTNIRDNNSGDYSTTIDYGQEGINDVSTEESSSPPETQRNISNHSIIIEEYSGLTKNSTHDISNTNKKRGKLIKDAEKILKQHKTKHSDKLEDEGVLHARKHKVGLSTCKKIDKSNTVGKENEEQIGSGFIENMRKQNMNRLIEMNHNSEDLEKYYSEDKDKYVNVSLINQRDDGSAETNYNWFKDAAKRRKNIFRHAALEKHRQDEVPDHGSWVFFGKDNQENDGFKNYKHNVFSNIKHPNHLEHLKHDNNNGDVRHISQGKYRKPKQSFKETTLESNQNEAKSESSNHSLSKEKHFKLKKPTHTLSKAYHKDITGSKHEKLAYKKKHGHGTAKDVERSFLDDNINDRMSSDLNIEGYGDSGFENTKVQLSEENSRKRGEREIKNGKKLNQSGRKNMFVNEHSSNANYDEMENYDVQEDPKYVPAESGDEDVHQQETSRRNDDDSQLSDHINTGSKNEDEEGLEEDEKKLFARRVYESKYNEEESMSTESCVDYKAERVSNTTTEAEMAQTTGITEHYTTHKVKTTPKTNIKSKPSKETVVKNGNLTADGEEMDEYDQFLCGQLADNFVNAVLKKVQRSRKLAKELGFSNNTEETCDRCIELRSFGIPDVDTIKNSLEKCSKSSNLNSRCYRVPKPMETFLQMLTLTEKEHSSSVYKNNQDDTSFIFNGDYPDLLTRKGNSEFALSSKYEDDKGSFGKDTVNKEHLREDINEEKSFDRFSDKDTHKTAGRKTFFDTRNRGKDRTQKDKAEKDDEDMEVVTKSNAMKHKFVTEDDSAQHGLLNTDENLQANDQIDSFETQDLSRTGRNKYSPSKTSTDFLEALEENPVKRRRKVYKSDKLQNEQDPELDGKYDNTLGGLHYGSRNYEYLKTYPEQSDSSKRSSGYNYYETIKQPFDNSFKPNIGELYSKKNSFLPSKSALESTKDKYSRKSELFRYSPEDYIDRREFSEVPNKKPFSSERMGDSDWKSNEYLYPGREADGFSRHKLHMTRNYNKDTDDSLRMVKRDTEPEKYDDELVFFEIPNIEYDLY